MLRLFMSMPLLSVDSSSLKVSIYPIKKSIKIQDENMNDEATISNLAVIDCLPGALDIHDLS